MAYSSSSLNFNSKVHTCSTECEQSYAQLKILFDTQREQLGDASIEIQAYDQALKKEVAEWKVVRGLVNKFEASLELNAADLPLSTAHTILDGVTNGSNRSKYQKKNSATTSYTNWKDVSDVVSRVKQIRIIDCEFMVVMGQAEGKGILKSVDVMFAKNIWFLKLTILLSRVGCPKGNKQREFKNHSSDNEESLGEDASKQGRIDNAYVKVTFIDETSNDARNKNNKISNSKSYGNIKPTDDKIGKGDPIWGCDRLVSRAKVIENQFDPSEDPSSDHIPPLPAISPFLSSADDTTDSNTPDIPPSPTHAYPNGRSYRYHLNGPVHMMTVRKRVGPLPTHRLAVRHSVDYSSLNHFSSDDSLSDSSSSSSSETSLDSPADTLSNSASSQSSSDHLLPASPSDILPSPKRICSPKTSMDLEDFLEDSFEPYVPREVGLGVDYEDESFEPSRSRGADLVMNVNVVRSDGIEIDPEIQAEIDECFAYVDTLRDKRIDARVVVEVVDQEESETGTRGQLLSGDLVQRFHDHTEAIPVHHVQSLRSYRREQGHRIVGAESTVTILTERVAELERDNRRLRGTMSFESQELTDSSTDSRRCLTHDLERQGTRSNQREKRIADARKH
ncbi:hypothetical protein Tco_0347547 [Tanacetum coccineum]